MKKDRYLLHIVLFLLAVVTTLMAGTELVTARSWTLGHIIPELKKELLTPRDLLSGWKFSLAFLTFLTFHEFGHYFTAVYHRVKCSLPFYIPLFVPIPGLMNIGSMGAVIRIREKPNTLTKFFDIGIAGPLAGFVVSIFLLWYGFSHLPQHEEFLYQLHPEYAVNGIPTEADVIANGFEEPAVGTSLLFEFFKRTVPEDPSLVPPDFELYHYPIIFVGFLTLFFTALNLLPIGQLDGGHVIYGLFGAKKAKIISRAAIICLITFGGLGFVRIELPPGQLLISGEFMVNAIMSSVLFLAGYLGYLFLIFRRIFKGMKNRYHWMMAGGLFLLQGITNLLIPDIQPLFIWLVYAFIVVMFLGVDHPRAHIELPLTPWRKALGWVAILIFILSFSPNPLRVI